MRFLFLFLLLAQSLSAQVKAFIFDFGEVIASTNRKPIIMFIADNLKTDAKKDFAGDELYAALEKGKDYWESYAKEHGKTLPAHWMKNLNNLADLIVQPLPGMLESVAELKQQGYRVALLSNTTKARSYFFRDHGYYKLFDPVILSWEVNLKKPDPEIYKLMLQKLNLAANECVFIDNLSENVQAARKLGMTGIHFKTPQQFRADLAKIVSPADKSVSK